jgi:hypothetical protein
MMDKLFPIRGTAEISCVGRKILMNRIWMELTKKTPDNISLIGPRDIGKTVLLKTLYERAKQLDSPYKLVIYWELGYEPPQTDEGFIEGLSQRLYDAMSVDIASFSEHRNELKNNSSFGVLKEILDLLHTDQCPVLMIWDGFDKPLSQGKLSGQLFGSLRSLFDGQIHRIVMATRSTQSGLARNQQVEDSPFWNIFNLNPTRVGPFDEADLGDALNSGSMSVDQGGRKELMNWSGGQPILLLSLLNSLIQKSRGGFSHIDVNEAAEAMVPELSDFMDKAWTGFPAETKSAFQLLAENDAVEEDQIGKEELRYLVERGYAKQEGKKVRVACRLLSRHVQGERNSISSFERLFGTWEAYRIGIRTLLEMRLNQIRMVDTRLHKLVRTSLQEIPDSPEDCLNNATKIQERALDLIWQHEFGGARELPQELIEYWTKAPRDKDWEVRRRMEESDWTMPRDRHKQLLILQWLTGSKEDFEPKAKGITKDTYVLLKAIHQYRNRTEHSDGQEIHLGVAVSGILLCIELLSCLERELG